MFEFAWASTKRHRNVDEARDSLFPAWRRNDVKHWSRIKLYPMAITLMPIRVLGFVMSSVLLGVANKIVMLGLDLDKPIPVRRRSITKLFYYMAGWGMAISTFCFPIKKIVN